MAMATQYIPYTKDVTLSQLSNLSHYFCMIFTSARGRWVCVCAVFMIFIFRWAFLFTNLTRPFKLDDILQTWEMDGQSHTHTHTHSHMHTDGANGVTVNFVKYKWKLLLADFILFLSIFSFVLTPNVKESFSTRAKMWIKVWTQKMKE